VRQVGTVDEIRESNDPVVRQFVEGRAEIDLEADDPGSPWS
jgi:ABC-type transporter Mla maintaining outer membrane lipid asymmetry ATPase subunit MlaF